MVDKRRLWRAQNQNVSIKGNPYEEVYLVYGTQGDIYEVDLNEPSCSCPDWNKRSPEDGCKHILKVKLENEYVDLLPNPKNDSGSYAATGQADYGENWDYLSNQTKKRDNWECQRCNAQGGPYGNSILHAHHIVPKAEGGEDKIENLITVCHDCHESIHGHSIPLPEKCDIYQSTNKRKNREVIDTDAQDKLNNTNHDKKINHKNLIYEMKSLRESLKITEDQRRDSREDLKKAKHQRKLALASIPLELDNEDLVNFEPVAWETLSNFIRRSQRVQAERETKKTAQQILDTNYKEHSLSELKHSKRLLENWLAAFAVKKQSFGLKILLITVFSSTFLALTSILLGLLVNPILFLILIVAISILWYGLNNRTLATESKNSPAHYRELFDKTDLSPPEVWNNEKVQSRLIELYDTISEHKILEERTKLHDELATGSEALQQKEKELENTRNELKEQLGASPETSDVELAVISKRVLDWQEANDRVQANQEAIKTYDESIERTCKKIQEKLPPHIFCDIGSSENVTKVILKLWDEK